LDDALAGALRKELSLESMLPQNRFSRAYVERQRGKWTLGRIVSRLYETTPERWMKKISEMVEK
jgi:hypothetical protein